MKEVKKINGKVRREYEPVQVKVTKVTPQGVLCQSGGSGDPGLSIKSYQTNVAI